MSYWFRCCFFFVILLTSFALNGQKTIISGQITDQSTKEALPYVKVKFLNSKVGALSDNLGNYRLETYYATDTLVVVFPGYLPQKKVIKLDEKQVINFSLSSGLKNIEEVTINAPAELSSTSLHKKLVANKKTTI